MLPIPLAHGSAGFLDEVLAVSITLGLVCLLLFFSKRKKNN